MCLEVRNVLFGSLKNAEKMHSLTSENIICKNGSNTY